MMGSSPSDDLLGSPPDDQRCNKNDGKFWRCGSWKMQGKSLCQRHFLKQAEYYNKKKTAPVQQQQKAKKRKSPFLDDNLEEKNNKKKKNEVIRSMSSEDDSINKLFEDDYTSGDDDDSIEKLFEDNYPSGSDDSCPLVTRSGSKTKKVSHAEDEDVEKLRKGHAESTTRS